MGKITNYLVENLKYIIILIFIIILRIYIFPLYEVDGASMDYTLAHGEKIIGTSFFEVDRFDIVIMDVPQYNKLYVKRVVGLPGDKIEYKDDSLYVNNVYIEEPYLDEKKTEWNQFTEDLLIEEVPEGHYYVLGDNRKASVDSRNIGFIPAKDILSELMLVYWPLDEIKILN